jgi:hypothetical protein
MMCNTESNVGNLSGYIINLVVLKSDMNNGYFNMRRENSHSSI